jgi:hypothetical protein
MISKQCILITGDTGSFDKKYVELLSEMIIPLSSQNSLDNELPIEGVTNISL